MRRLQEVNKSPWPVVVFVILIIAFLGFVFLYSQAPNTPQTQPGAIETTLMKTFFGGFLLMIVSLIVSVFILAQLGLADPGSAFGMPEGTIRAAIALSLIIIFAMMSIHLYGQLRIPSTTDEITISETKLNDIAPEKIFSMVEIPQAAPSSAAAEKQYKVRLLVPSQGKSDDFALQVLTTISTLVVAVAGFYFGTKAVQAAKERPGGEISTVTIVRPTSPYPATPGEVINIAIETTPAGMAVDISLNGDTADPALTRVSLNAFTYTVPADSPVKPAVILIALTSQPEIQDTLVIKPAVSA